MHVLLYAWVALCGFGAGWALGTGMLPWIVAPLVGMAALGCWLLSCTRELAYASPGLGSSLAHRAWFSSAWACLIVLVMVWLLVGWSLPSLRVDGLMLDPAGALGWTPQWLLPRLLTAQWLLVAGMLGLAFSLGAWAWQKRQGKSPDVLVLWTAAPFFWMAALGLLIGLSQPWRQAVSHPLARQWHADMSAPEVASMARRALLQSRTESAAAVWAHALGVRAYQAGAFNRKDLDGFLGKLAAMNAQRQASSLLPSARVVGVEQVDWCRANLLRRLKPGEGWAQVQSECAKMPSGRTWEWMSP